MLSDLGHDSFVPRPVYLLTAQTISNYAVYTVRLRTRCTVAISPTVRYGFQRVERRL